MSRRTWCVLMLALITISAAGLFNSIAQGQAIKIVAESLADQIQWFLANGLMKQSVKVEQAIDLSFIK